MLAAPPISVRLLPPPERCENDNCGSIITDGVAKIVAYSVAWPNRGTGPCATGTPTVVKVSPDWLSTRSEEHTSELQSHSDLVCRLLLEKKKPVLKLQDATAVNTLLTLVHYTGFTTLNR